jgi:hypothetical protein
VIGGGATGSTARCIHFLCWGPVTLAPTTKRPAYTLAFTVFERVHVAHLEFDFRVMRYTVATMGAQLPATGFSRSYCAGCYDTTGRMLLGGTAAGELAVYSILPAGAPAGAASASVPSPLFKTALAASGNGVHALCMCPKPAPTPQGSTAAAAAPAAPAPATAPPPRCAVFLGGGDGVLRCFVGRDFDWACSAEARLPARIVSIALAASGAWLLVGTAAGGMYRVAWGQPQQQPQQQQPQQQQQRQGGAVVPLACGAMLPPSGRPLTAYADLLELSHTGALHALAFNSNARAAGDAMVTAGGDGTLRLWDLNDYKVTWSLHGGAGAPSPACLWVDAVGEGEGGGGGGNGGGNGGGGASSAPGLPCELYVGYSDGTLRAYRVRGRGEEVLVGASAPAGSRSSSGSSSSGSSSELWRANAHRGGVSCIAGSRACLVTGGGDARVCVWSRRNHDLLLTFNDHGTGGGRPIVGVAIDPRSPEVVYSAGGDGGLATYNLRAERRVKAHALPAAEAHACALTAFAQLHHASSEHELLAGTSDGRVFVFDPDVAGGHCGAVDVLALLGEARGRCAREVAAGMGAGGGGGGGLAAAGAASAPAAAAAQARFPLPSPKPGQARPELRISALAVSPTSRYLAVGTACGRLIVLGIPAYIGSGGTGGGGGSGGGGGGGGVPRRGPINAGVYSDLGGAQRPALVSQAAVMRALSCFLGGAHYAGVRWAPDERQVVGVCSDSTVQVFNFFADE